MAKIRKFTYSVIYPRVLMKRFIVQEKHKRFHLVELGKNQQQKIIKRLKFNIRQWSQNVVCYLRRTYGSTIHVEEEFINVNKSKEIIVNDVSKQLREQLELLKSGKRTVPLIEPNSVSPLKTSDNSYQNVACTDDSLEEMRSVLEKTPEKENELIDELNSKNNSPISPPSTYKVITDNRPDEENVKIKENSEKNGDSIERNGNFIDMLMRKMGATNTRKSSTCKLNVESLLSQSCSSDKDSISSEDFLGFDDQNQKKQQITRPTGLLCIPAISERDATSADSVFVSESLDKYLRANALDSQNANDSKGSNTTANHALKYKAMVGLVTQNCIPPPMDEPLVPESLARLRTVAERRQFLQRSARNHKLAIINNEAAIYRELQRKVRRNHQQLRKHSSAVVGMQAPEAHLPFTRTGWRATSFIATECNKYYYQMLPLDNGDECVRLAGGHGNNDVFELPTYISHNSTNVKTNCPENCLDAQVWRQLKSTSSLPAQRAKLNNTPLPAALPACPLSKKPFQKPLDDDIAPLAGGKIMVVRMPSVQLEVFPEIGRPLDELAKRYLQLIMPHEEITEEWAKFSASTLKLPLMTNQEKENLKRTRCSFKFAIPYNNDQNQILVRRVIDRSEKLDKCFEDIVKGLKPLESIKTDLTFRKNIDQSDEELVACADVVSELINSVVISCSENSFIKDDPDALLTSDTNNDVKKENLLDVDESKNSTKSISVSASVSGACQKQQDHNKSYKKQSRLVNELRRLNATIIETSTPSTENADMKTCTKEHCALGCVCNSLNEPYPYRQHCGKARCIIECKCRTVPKEPIMRLETDARNISTQDAFNIRQQATARLARMEKEFTSTVVLSENEPLLINESQYEKKRRCTKAPKRYEDYADTSATDTDTTSEFMSPVKGRATPSIVSATSESNRRSITPALSDTSSEIVYVQDDVLEELKHCSVKLTRLEIPKQIAVWCMVHELYKCFCGGHATEGKPVVIEKEPKKPVEIKVPKGSNVNLAPVAFVPKSRYSFDKHEKKIKINIKDNELYNTAVESVKPNKFVTPTNSNSNSSSTTPIATTTKPNIKMPKFVMKSKAQNISYLVRYNQNDSKTNNSIKKNVEKMEIEEVTMTVEKMDIEKKSDNEKDQCKTEISSSDESSSNDEASVFQVRTGAKKHLSSYLAPKERTCRRAVPIPSLAYKRKNALRKSKVLDFIKRTENEKTRLLLSEHWMRSVFYYKRELEENKKRTENSNNRKNQNHSAVQTKDVKPKKKSNSETTGTTVVELSDDDVSNNNDVDDNDDITNSNGNESGRDNDLSEDDDWRLSSYEAKQMLTINDNDGNIQKKSMLKRNIKKSSRYSNDNETIKKMRPSTPTTTTPEIVKSTQLTNTNNDNDGFLKITNCFSLNANAKLEQSSNYINYTHYPRVINNTNKTTTTSIESANPSLKSMPSRPSSIASPSPSSTQTPPVTAKIELLSKTTNIDVLKNQNNSNWLSIQNACSEQNGNLQYKELYGEVIKYLNFLVSKKIQDIDTAMHRESKVVPAPNDEILCIVTWKNFVDAFKERNIFVWQIKLPSTCFLAVTILNVMPIIMGAIAVENIVYVKMEKLPLMARMLVNGLINDSTNHLGIVMQGHAQYWHVKGFLQPDENAACAKPTPESHPLLTRKINLLFTLLLKQRIRRLQQTQSKHIGAGTSSMSSQISMPTPAPSPSAPIAISPSFLLQNAQHVNDVKNVLLQSQVSQTQEVVAAGGCPRMITPPMQTTQSPGAATTSTVVLTPRSLLKPRGFSFETYKKNNNERYANVQQNMISSISLETRPTINNTNNINNSIINKNKLLFNNTKPITMRSNVNVRRIRQDDVDELYQPELRNDDHRWFVLDLYNDFSHIFVPDFHDLVSLDRVQKMMSFSKEKKKIVKLQFFQNAPYDAFVTPSSMRKLYFGPLKIGIKPPIIVLLQSVDGRLMLRETFQVQHNVKPHPLLSTTAFWMLQLNNEVFFEYDIPKHYQNRAANLISAPVGAADPTKITTIMMKPTHQNQTLLMANDAKNRLCKARPPPLVPFVFKISTTMNQVLTTATTITTTNAQILTNTQTTKAATTTTTTPTTTSTSIDSDDDDCLIIDEDNNNDDSLSKTSTATTTPSTSNLNNNNKSMFTFAINSQNNQKIVQINNSRIWTPTSSSPKNEIINSSNLNNNNTMTPMIFMPIVLGNDSNIMLPLSPTTLKEKVKQQQQQLQQQQQQHEQQEEQIQQVFKKQEHSAIFLPIQMSSITTTTSTPSSLPTTTSTITTTISKPTSTPSSLPTTTTSTITNTISKPTSTSAITIISSKPATTTSIITASKPTTSNTTSKPTTSSLTILKPSTTNTISKLTTTNTISKLTTTITTSKPTTSIIMSKPTTTITTSKPTTSIIMSKPTTTITTSKPTTSIIISKPTTTNKITSKPKKYTIIRTKMKSSSTISTTNPKTIIIKTTTKTPETMLSQLLNPEITDIKKLNSSKLSELLLDSDDSGDDNALKNKINGEEKLVNKKVIEPSTESNSNDIDEEKNGVDGDNDVKDDELKENEKEENDVDKNNKEINDNDVLNNTKDTDYDNEIQTITITNKIKPTELSTCFSTTTTNTISPTIISAVAATTTKTTTTKTINNVQTNIMTTPKAIINKSTLENISNNNKIITTTIKTIPLSSSSFITTQAPVLASTSAAAVNGLKPTPLNGLKSKTFKLRRFAMREALGAGFKALPVVRGMPTSNTNPLSLHVIESANLKLNPTTASTSTISATTTKAATTSSAPLTGNITNSPIDKFGKYLKTVKMPLLPKSISTDTISASISSPIVNCTSTSLEELLLARVSARSTSNITATTSTSTTTTITPICENNTTASNNSYEPKSMNNIEDNSVQEKLNSLSPQPTEPTIVGDIGTIIDLGNLPLKKNQNKTFCRKFLIPNRQFIIGYFTTGLPQFPKFPTKRVRDIFHVRIPKVGTITISGVADVNKFLNEHVKKNAELLSQIKDFLPAQWIFRKIDESCLKRSGGVLGLSAKRMKNLSNQPKPTSLPINIDLTEEDTIVIDDD